MPNLTKSFHEISLTKDEIWDLAVDSDLVCTYYDEFFYELGNWQRDIMIDVVGGIAGKTVLDIGCGGLRFGTFIMEELANGHYYGVDPYHKFLDFGRKISEKLNCVDKVTLIQSKNCDFPSDIKFDFAMSQSVFTHMSEGQILDCLEKLLPIMKPGGKLVFTYITTKLPHAHHDGRLYQEAMPVVCAYLAGTKILQDFATKHNLHLIEDYTEVPHPTNQKVGILSF